MTIAPLHSRLHSYPFSDIPYIPIHQTHLSENRALSQLWAFEQDWQVTRYHYLSVSWLGSPEQGAELVSLSYVY